MRTTIPPHEISLIGKSVIRHATDSLSMICDDVYVEYARHAQESDGELVSRVLHRLPVSLCAETTYLVAHSAFWPVIRYRLLADIRQAMDSGARAVITGADISKQVPLEEPPVALRLAELQKVLASPNRKIQSLVELANYVASCMSCQPVLVGRSYIAGELFRQLSLDEAEALLRTKGQAGVTAKEKPPRKPNKVLVIGASGGIGQACVDLLESRQMDYVAPSREQLDLCEEATFDQLQLVDAVIHSGGAYACSPEEIMAVNFHSCYRLLRAAEALRWRGCIVFLSSTAATFGRPSTPIYSASKAALNSLIESEAESLHEKGVLINAVAPAKVATRLQVRLNPGSPLREMITPEYVAKLVLRTLAEDVYGKIVYLRKGEDC